MTPKAFLLFKILFIVLMATALLCATHDILAEEVLTVKIVSASGGLNVRSAPTTSAPAVYLLEDCETVIVLATMDGWTLVGKNIGDHSPIGWVNAAYLR